MSRIGKKPIELPENVTLTIKGYSIQLKGPLGELTQNFPEQVSFEQKDKQIFVTVANPKEKNSRSLWGLSKILLANMLAGVTKGFEKKLEINGVGFKADLKGKKLILQIGFSHPVEFYLPDGIDGKVEKNIITITGINKNLVGETAARIRSIKKPEPYKGKGIKYIDEIVRRKAGKVVKGVEEGK